MEDVVKGDSNAIHKNLSSIHHCIRNFLPIMAPCDSGGREGGGSAGEGEEVGRGGCVLHSQDDWRIDARRG